MDVKLRINCMIRSATKKEMIPKIIHYCWFGGNPLPELAQRCIASWRRFFPDYEIREWNEGNHNGLRAAPNGVHDYARGVFVPFPYSNNGGSVSVFDF